MACRDEEYRNNKGIKMNRGGSQPLVIFKYNKECITEDTIDTLGLFRSIVYDKKEKKVVCVSPPKSKNINKFQDKYKLEDCVVKEFVTAVGVVSPAESLNDCVAITLTSNRVAPPLVKEPKPNNSLSPEELIAVEPPLFESKSKK